MCSFILPKLNVFVVCVTSRIVFIVLFFATYCAQINGSLVTAIQGLIRVVQREMELENQFYLNGNRISSNVFKKTLA